MPVRRLVLSFVLIAACEPADIRIRGRVERARERPGFFAPLVGGTVTILDQRGDPYASDVTNDLGKFDTRGPAGQIVFATIEGSGLATSSFTGITGAPNTGDLVVPVDAEGDSPLYGVTLDEVDDLVALFAGCPGAGEAGGVVFGQVKVIGITDPVTDEEPIVTTGEVRISGANEVELAACYLDDAGLAYDPLATVTGDSGRWAIFGVEPGLWTLGVSYSAFVESPEETFSDIFVPDAPLPVVPREPTWVEFPF